MIPPARSSVLLNTVAFAILGLLLGGAKCGKDSNTPGEKFSCEKVALRTEDGEIENCDLQACEACVAECGAECAVLESYPPQYSCQESHTYSVYEFCPEWQSPAG